MFKEEESKIPEIPTASTQLVNWFLLNRNAILICASACIVAALFFVWLMNHRQSQQYQAFHEAEKLAENLEKPSDTIDSKEALSKLQKINDTYSSLQGRYNGLIAQELLIEEQNSSPYSQRSIDKLKTSGLTAFADFAEIALLTEQKEFAKALEKSVPLSTQPDIAYTMKAYLLLQIAILHQALGQKEAVKTAVNDLKSFLEEETTTRTLSEKEKEIAASILSQLQENDESLLNYLVKDN